MNTTRTMITFKQNGAKFTYRIGGIAIHQGCILFQRATLDPNNLFWFLPGGRAELGESAEGTLRREMQEELGEHVEIERLLYIVENFFTGELQHHELGLYFLMHISATSYLLHEPGPYLRDEEGEPPMTFEWLPISQIPQLNIMPHFLRTALRTLPDKTIHIVQTDE